MISGNGDNTIHNEDHNLISLCSFESINHPDSIYIYSSPHQKNSYFILFELEKRFLVMSLKFHYNSNDLSFTKEIKEFTGMKLYSKSNHFFRRNISEDLFPGQNDSKLVFYKDKVLVFLNNLGNLSFVDGINIFFSINLFNIFHNSFPEFNYCQVKRFEIINGK